jgi:cyclin-dependent kinase inhibitor 3
MASTLQPTTTRSEFDSSDEEDALVDQEKLDITWIAVRGFEHEETAVAVSPLPGCRFAETRRSLVADLETIQKAGIKDVFVLCTSGELERCRVPSLLQELASADLSVHYHPLEEGGVPSNEECVLLLTQLIDCVKSRRPTLVQ